MSISRLTLPTSIRFDQVSIACSDGKISISAASSQKQSVCPVCKIRNKCIHSHYHRILADLPISGYNVQVLLYSRKFFCNNERCHRKIFTERFTSELNAYGRRFSRTADLLAKIGLELGGNKGAVVSRLIGCPVSATTMLRVVKN